MILNQKLSKLEDKDLLDFYYQELFNQIFHTNKLGRLMTVPHRILEKWDPSTGKVMEIGATDGQHLEFVNFDLIESYTAVDIRFSNTLDMKAKSNSKVSYLIQNAERNLPFPEGYFDKLLTTYVLHHLANLPNSLSYWRSLVKPGGVLNYFVPLDNTPVYKLGRELTSVRSAKRIGVSRDNFHRILKLVHRNTVSEIMKNIFEIHKNDYVVLHLWPHRFFKDRMNVFLLISIKLRYE